MKSEIGPITRIHEWAADRFSFVQYPDIRPVRREARRAFFKHQMPWYMRIGLFFFGICLLLLGAVMIGALGLLAYSVFSG